LALYQLRRFSLQGDRKITRNKPPAATLVDVAREAGVSMSTAARVIRNPESRVDMALQQKVRAAATLVGYVPNLMARNLRAGAPKIIGLVVGHMMDPYYGEIAEAITDWTESYSMVAMVCNMQRDPLLELKYCQQLWGHRVGGLILAGGGFDQWTHQQDLADLVDQMSANGVVIATLSPRNVKAPVFCVDNEQVGRCAATELIAHGHQSIGLLIGHSQNQVTQQRFHGISETCAHAGVELQVVHADYNAESAAEAAARMLADNKNITGLIAGSYSMSMGITSWLQASGRSVPEEISVVGIGNPMLAAWSSPPLTAVDLCLQTCGQSAVDFVVGRVRGLIGGGDGQTVQPRLIQGKSVAQRKHK
jgi:LacI family transcriptional regulator